MCRDIILDLHHDGLSERQIAQEVRVSHTYVGKVIKRYDESNTDLRAQRSHFVKAKVDQTVSEYIECCRLMNPSICGSEIRQRLLRDGVVHPHAMTRKRITVVPSPPRRKQWMLSLKKFPTLGHQSYIFRRI